MLKFTMLMLFTVPALSATSGVSYHGRILQPDGVTPVSGVVTFKIEIHSPGTSNCVMYAETQSQDLTRTAGVFALTIGEGTRYGYQALTLDKVFSNGSTFDLSGSTCVGSTSYPSAAGDPREIYVWFQSASMVAFEEMPAVDLNYAPLAIEAQQISGFKASSLLRTDSSVAYVSPLNNSQYTQLLALVAGTSSLYSAASSASGTEIISANGNVSSPSVGSVWLDTSSNTIKVYTSSGIETVATSTGANFLTAVAQGPGINVNTAGGTATVGIGTSAIITSMLSDGAVTASKIASGSLTGGLLDPTLSILTSGNIGAAGLSSRIVTISNSQTPVDSSHNEVSLLAPSASFTGYSLSLPTSAGSSGQVLSSNGSGNLIWSTVGTGTSMPAIASGQIYVGSAGNTPAAVTPSGDISLTNGGAVTVSALQGVGIGASMPTASGQVLRYDSTTTKYQSAFLSMNDIRSVAMPGLTIFPTTSCTAAQTINWSSLTDQFTCTNIALSSTSVSGLGSAALLNVGTGSLSIVQLDSSSRLPPVDGSQLSNLNASSITAGTISAARLPALATLWSTDGTNIYRQSGNIGIGTTSPLATLDVAGAIRFEGATSGYVGFQSPASGGSTIYTLPGTVTSGAYLTTDSSGILSWAVPSGTGISALSGDVTASGTGTVAATVAQVGGVTAANVATGSNLANAAVSNNTMSTIVRRDASGNFAANTITSTAVVSEAVTQTSSVYKDSGSNTVTVQAPASVSAPYVLKWPIATGVSEAGKVLSTDGSGNLSWIAAATGSVTDVTASAPLSSTGGSAPALSISRATTSNDGYLAASDFNAFSNKLSTTLSSSNIWIGNSSNIATAVAATGDVSVTNAGVFTVSGVKGKNVSATPTLSGQVLRYDGTNWTPNFVSMADLRSTVTGASSASSCTAGQTLTYTSVTDNLSCTAIALNDSQITYGSQSANKVFAAPNGVAGAPVYRSLAAADLPAGGYDTTYFKPGGNSFGALGNLGLADNNQLNLLTNGLSRISITAGGNVGIGTTAPRSQLDIQNGSFTLKPEVVNTSAIVDFSTGNLQYTANSCGAFQFNNLKDGGTYSFAVKGITSATCSFTAYNDAGTTAIVVHLPPGHSATTAGKHTLYSIMVMGSDAYFAWIPGY